ncbi:MAG: serine/threonine protein kinase [Myxococcaceae bacterium]
MAELFLAKDTGTDELVVIKRILPYLSEEAEFVRMFLDEARIAAQLHHANIIQVHELGKLGEAIFICMEYLEGIDLRKVLQEEMKLDGVVPYPMAAYVTAQLCAGLHYAHNRIGLDGKAMGIVHRDVSPQNVMVGFDGSVKLVDFGIAKAGALVERSKPGVIKGKFLYLAPEQLSQDRVDHRADLFALGTMLYEVTTAKSPFYKPTTEAVIYAIRTEDPPPPHLIIPEYPLALSQVVMKCLTKDRNRRYQQAGEVQRDLEKYLSREHATAQDLVRYIAGLMGSEDERTALFIPPSARPAPKPSSREEATRPMAAHSSSRGPVGRRPTSENPAVDYDPGYDPPTQTARPEDLAAVLNGQPGGTVSPPARRDTGQKYVAAGDGYEVSTTASSASLPGMAEPTRGSSDSLPQLTPTPSQPSGESSEPSEVSDPGDPVFDSIVARAEQRARPSRPGRRLPTEELSAEDERSTGDFQSRFSNSGASDPRGRLTRNPLVLGAIAFAAVLVLALVVWKATRDTKETPPRGAISKPLAPKDPPKKPGVVVPPVQPPEVVEAGQGEAEAAVPERVSVLIKAPGGTRINSGKYNPGATYELFPGPLRLVYRCPPKSRRRKSPVMDRTYKVATPPGGGPFVIQLCGR